MQVSTLSETCFCHDQVVARRGKKQFRRNLQLHSTAFEPETAALGALPRQAEADTFAAHS